MILLQKVLGVLNGYRHKPISEGGVLFTSNCNEAKKDNLNLNTVNTNSSSSNLRPNKKKGGHVQSSIGFMKKIARMPAHDIKQILHILKKQKRKRKGRASNINSKKTSASITNSSNTTSPSVNNDWENWVMLHGKANVVKADVKDVGKVVGVKYHCDTKNSFNLLTREGRKEWRAACVSEVARGEDGDLVGEDVVC